MTKNSTAWDTFFSKTSTLDEITEQGYSYVTAENIKKISGREPRLLAKIDTWRECPEVFRKHSLTIFPVENGKYIIFKDLMRKTYFGLDEAVYPVVLERYTSKIDLYRFDSFPGIQRLNESQALDFAFISSLLCNFTGDNDLNLVIRGRTFSGRFDFRLPNVEHQVKVSSVQIEIDGGYESNDAIYLIEVKTGRREDFHIRQLYYPFLEWSNKSRKRIVPIFLIFTNGKFYFFQFGFQREFGDLRVERAQGFVVNEAPTTEINIALLIEQTVVEQEPNVPFPQANDLDKIVDLIALADRDLAAKTEIASYFEFDERQADYYANAGIYLGFLARHGNGFLVTKLGQRFIGTNSLSMRTNMMVEQMLKHSVFRSAFERWRICGFKTELLNPAEIARSIENYTSLTGSTPMRRASTVVRWLRWVKQNAKLQP
ncbi:hypothetical protein [Caldilinea sp.]|uniref:type II restriction enzyme n=1 Tax=Caldilinea sp. TaxID=2293560 RepID=UPI002C3EBE12|nr:hypothetical protein [Anaerolineales bacterium]HQY94625.1 hypothetical protein [Caldilinea sp.]